MSSGGVVMLDQDANISFIQEIMDAIDAFLVDYQARHGQLRNDLERGLVISYLLGIMQCEIESRVANESRQPRHRFRTRAAAGIELLEQSGEHRLIETMADFHRMTVPGEVGPGVRILRGHDERPRGRRQELSGVFLVHEILCREGHEDGEHRDNQ